MNRYLITFKHSTWVAIIRAQTPEQALERAKGIGLPDTWQVWA